MTLRHPKLLRREYLNRSPIWKSYLSGSRSSPIELPVEAFQINTKLYSVYMLAEMVRGSERSGDLV